MQIQPSQGRSSIELFAGAGGLGIGLARADFIPEAVVEFDRWCCNTLRANLDSLAPGHKCQVIESDVRQIDFSQYEGIDLVSGGPPCQPFSLGGKHQANRDDRDMFPQAVRAVREAKPKAFVFENVKGLTRNRFRNYLNYIQLQLEHPCLVAKTDEDWINHLGRLEQHHTSKIRSELNYKVVVRLVDAADFGVPQRRERVVFVGFRDDIDANWTFGESTHTNEALVWDQMYGDYWDRHRIPKSQRTLQTRATGIAKKLSATRPASLPWQTVRDAISNLPNPKLSKARAFKNHVFQPGARVYPGHTGSFIDEPSKALKAGVHGVPGGENMVRYSNGAVRYFTVRESARLQSFPDNYEFQGSWSETMRQLGNAVPAKLATAIGKSVAAHLDAAQEH